jgi:hypothetical protein
VQTLLELKPVDNHKERDQVLDFIAGNHRHHKIPTGYKFAIRCFDGDKLVGVVVVGRPVSRELQDGLTAEVTRLCSDGTKNVCSKLLGAAQRTAFAMGYKRVISYILQNESGVSYRAANWHLVGSAGGGKWSRPSRIRIDDHPTEQKQLWEVLA